MQSASFFIHDLSTLYVPCLVLIVYALIGNSDLELQLYHRECQPAWLLLTGRTLSIHSRILSTDVIPLTF